MWKYLKLYKENINIFIFQSPTRFETSWSKSSKPFPRRNCQPFSRGVRCRALVLTDVCASPYPHLQPFPFLGPDKTPCRTIGDKRNLISKKRLLFFLTHVSYLGCSPPRKVDAAAGATRSTTEPRGPDSTPTLHSTCGPTANSAVGSSWAVCHHKDEPNTSHMRCVSSSSHIQPQPGVGDSLIPVSRWCQRLASET